jgi:uncharacterized membrane protein (UPF0127 family)
MTQAKNFVARDVQTGLTIANRVTIAATRAQRAIGLLGRTHLEPGEALWITPCHGVHTCFMRFSIDILALDQDGVVVDAVSMLKPWRFRLPQPGAFSVLELPAGTLLSVRTKLGHHIKIDDLHSSLTPALNEPAHAARTSRTP